MCICVWCVCVCVCMCVCVHDVCVYTSSAYILYILSSPSSPISPNFSSPSTAKLGYLTVVTSMKEKTHTSWTTPMMIFISTSPPPPHPSRLVEEFMLLANMAVARKIASCFETNALLRRHAPPKEHLTHKLVCCLCCVVLCCVVCL